MKKFLFMLCLLMGYATLHADTETVDGITWDYHVSNGKATIGGEGEYSAIPSSTAGAITIPSSLGGYPVTSIGDEAFCGCGSLTSVTIPSSVTSIGDWAFSNCFSLTSVTIPEGVTSIGDDAFGSCFSLTSATIPSSVTLIGDGAFGACSGLTSFVVAKENQNYTAINGLLCSKDGKTLITCPGGMTSVTIPSSVTSIGDDAFWQCLSLTSVTIPLSVTSIGSYAFYNCYRLRSVTIPSSVTSIGDKAFDACFSLTSFVVANENQTYTAINGLLCSKDGKTLITCPVGLTSVTIPEGVTSIGDDAFWQCLSLTSVTIPSSVTSIGNYAFFNCASLTSVTIPSSVTTIENHAFSGCDNLTSVTIPRGVTTIGDYAFYNCYRLRSVTIPSSVTSIGEGAFWDCSSLTSVTIPSSVTSTGDYAFSGCESLTSVTILEGVTTIGERAFEDCPSLTSVTIPSSVVSIGYAAFLGCESLRSVYFWGKPPSVDSNAFYDFSATGYYSPKYASAWASVIDSEGKWDGLVMTMGSPTSSLPTYRVPIPHPAATFTATAVGEEQVTLKVTAQKGYVFAGWYTDDTFTKTCDSFLADYRNPTYTYNIAPDNLNFNALFVTAEEDTLLDLVGTEAIPTKGSDQRAIQLVIDSYSLPKVSVTGLPAGMKFTATPVMVKGSKTEVDYPANTIYGTPTKPGIYTVKVALTNTTITKAITKTFDIEVPNLTAPGIIDVYDYYGEYVPGVSYVEEVPEAKGCTVTGLPAGMKWTAKDIVDLKTKEVTVPANSVYGVPTTPGNYTVYFTKTVNKVKYTATATFKVGPYPQLNVMVSDDGVGGKVTGTGGFAANKTATLRATPNKGYVFAGWYEDEFFRTPCDSTLVDYRNPSYTYVMGTTNKTFHARFVAKEEDNWLELMVNDEEIWNETGFGDILTFEVFGESEFNFELGSESLPKATVTGLPTGMKFTATPVMVKGSKTEVEYPANTIYGTPTKPGIYTVKVALTNTTITKAITKTFNIEVPNLKAPGIIDVYNYYGEYVPGVSYVEEVPEAEGCTVTGLPAGMKWTAKDIVNLKTKEVTVPANSVYGVPTTPGNYTVYFTKTVDKVKYTATATFAVGPYPQLNVMVSDDGVGGKVTGTGGFAANKTATLKATPNQGYIFAGWYKDGYPCDSTLVDYRTPSYTYVMGEEDTQFYARFVTKDEEADYEMGIELIDEYYNSLGDNVQVRAGEVMEPVKVWVDSLTLPTVTVTGLPTGLKFDAKTFTISGKPTKPGFYPISIEAKNASKSRSAFAIVNLEVRHFNAHGLHGDLEDAEPIVIDAFTTELFDLEDWFGGFFDGISIKSLTLPVGLIYNATTGEIKGNGTLKCGSHTVTLTDKAGQVTTFTLVAELDEADMFTYEDYLTPSNDWQVYNGVVQGANTDIWWISILKCKEEEGMNWDDYYLDMATAQALSVKVTGLPSGLRASFEKYCSEEKTYECDIYLEGKTSAAPGDYPVTVTISNSRTGQVEHVSSVIRIFPAPSIQMKKKFTLEADDYYDENGKPLEAHAEVTYTINGISGIAAYKVTMERPNGKQFVTSGSLPLNDIFVTATASQTDNLEYAYYFYTATSIAEADIGLTLNEGVPEVTWAWLGYTEDYSFSWYP